MEKLTDCPLCKSKIYKEEEEIDIFTAWKNALALVDQTFINRLVEDRKRIEILKNIK